MSKIKKYDDFISTNESVETNFQYWDGQGKHQEEYDRLYKELVLSSGSSETLNGELIRAVSRLYHENANNGNCNAKEDEWENCNHCSGSGEVEKYDYDEEYDDSEYEECPECWGEGKIEEEAKIDSFYQKFIDLIRYNVPEARDTVDAIEVFITTGRGDENKYDTLVDQVVEYVLKTEDKPLPTEYQKD